MEAPHCAFRDLKDLMLTFLVPGTTDHDSPDQSRSGRTHISQAVISLQVTAAVQLEEAGLMV